MALTDEQLAQEAGVPTRVISAIRSVESAGRAAAIRFEPHLFHIRTGTGGCLGRPPGSRCTGPEIVAQIRHTSIPYTPSEGSVVDRTRSHTDANAFRRAHAIDPDAAIRASSFGMFQVLGGAGIAAYGSGDAFLRAFSSDALETSQRLFAKWFDTNPTAKRAANTGDWATLARAYNGSGPGGSWYANFTSALSRLTDTSTGPVRSTASSSAGGAGLLLLAAGAAAAFYFGRGLRR